MPTANPVFSFEAIGTRWSISLFEELNQDQLSQLLEKITARIDAFDRTYSRFRADSLASQASSQTGKYTFPEDAKSLFEFYRKLYDVTDGKVTPLIGNVLVESGYDASYSLTPAAEIHEAPDWDETFSYRHPVLNMKKPAVMDFGAAGKGYLVDIIGELLKSEGIDNFLIDAGGDMLHHTAKPTPIRVGLEHPKDPSLAVGVLELGNESVCGSATNRRAWRGLHHIMDPDSSEPVEGIAAVWVVAKSAMMADGLSTALFFTSADQLGQLFDFEYCLVRSDMSYERSPGLRGEMFAESAHIADS